MYCSVNSSSHTSHATQQIYGLCLVFNDDRAFGRLPLYSSKKPVRIDNPLFPYSQNVTDHN